MRIVMLVASLWLVTPPLWGKIVFYSKQDGNEEIYTMNSEGNHQTRLTFNEAREKGPTWSPNGQQIAFMSQRDGNWEIYVMDADGSNQRNLTRHPAFDVSPDWHPHGHRIAFASDQNSGKNPDLNIFVMDADGSNLKQITHIEFAADPQWSPDGKQILFEGDIDQGRQIYAIQPNGRGMWRVSEPMLNAWMFLGGWSPDGTQVLYKGSNDGDVKDSFAVIATLGPQRTKVTKRENIPLPKMPFSTVSFGAEGKSILFIGRRVDIWNIYRFRLSDRKLIQLTNHPQGALGPHEWNPRLSVPPQQGLLPQRWGEIKAGEWFGRRSRD